MVWELYSTPKEPLALLSRLFTSFAADEFTVKGLKTSTRMSTFRQKPPQNLECPFQGVVDTSWVVVAPTGKYRGSQGYSGGMFWAGLPRGRRLWGEG